MSLKDDLLAAVWEQPHADHPRLVYADWLEEQGDAARAEFIRLQCELARLEFYDKQHDPLQQRSERLWQANKSEWKTGLPSELSAFRFERGFIAPPIRNQTLNSFLALQPVWDEVPSWKMALTASAANFVKLAAHVGMKRVGVLNYKAERPLSAKQAQVFSEGHFHNVREFQYWCDEIRDDTVERICEHACRFPNLRRLTFGWHARFSDRTLRALAASPLLDNVTELRLPHSQYTAAAFQQLLESGRLRQCRFLMMPAILQPQSNRGSWKPLPDESECRAMLRAVMTTSMLPNLERLHLEIDYSPVVTEIFQHRPAFRLKELGVVCRPEDFEYFAYSLAEWPGASDLLSLDLYASQMPLHAMQALFGSSHLSSLNFFTNLPRWVNRESLSPDIQRLIQERFGSTLRQPPRAERMESIFSPR